MSKINILSSKIYNRIAAGEVIERPFSVVKELVENAIDAKATKINIEILNGGINEVKVSDNGCGIEKSELQKAILPHATSKISKIEDLDCLISLGFRGEALASIASVSKLTITSKTKESENGAQLYCEGGENIIIKDCAFNTGTEIIVDNLFFNTPARERFLKKEKSEESEITSIISKLILSHPEINFVYISNNKKIYQSFGDGLESALISIYGPKTINDCFFINSEKNGLKISGYIGKQYFTKSNRSYQSLFINNRYIQNQTISLAIQNAYSSYIMKRQYPFYVLSVKIPPELIDVNVTPSKTDVRFVLNEIIYGTFYSIISKVLDGSSEALNIVVEDKNKTENSQNQNNEKINCDNAQNILEKSNKNCNNYVCNNQDVSNQILFKEKLNFNDIENVNIKTSSDNDNVFKENQEYLLNLERKNLDLNFINNNINTQKNNFTNEFDNKNNIDLIQNKQSNFENKDLQTKIDLNKKLNYIGQVLNTYLIFDDGFDVYLIDQHAAHERILFDKYYEEITNSKIEIQNLLVPFILDVNSYEFEFISKSINELISIGIEIEEFGGNTFKVSAIPACIADLNLKDFFNSILSNLNELKKINIPTLLRDKIAQKACKSAIKAGYKATDEDVKQILTMLKGNLGLKCPHGRPIAVKIERNEIEKWFKRIV